MKDIKYGNWSSHPEVIVDVEELVSGDPTFLKLKTKHEGKIVYERYWNFWIRAGKKGNLNSNFFFRDYNKSDKNTDKLFTDIGVSSSYPTSETEIWDRIGILWTWLATKVQTNDAAYGKISSQPNSWPSILDYAKYYAAHSGLVWAACFSKAHLLISLLGRIIPLRRRILLAEAHHTEGNASSNATHVYVGIYASDRWFYLDPTALLLTQFPSFGSRQSIGVTSFPSVDYEHPYSTIMLPGSDFEYVPYLSV